MQINKGNFVSFQLFEPYRNLLAVVSTRKAGNLKGVGDEVQENLKSFLGQFSAAPERLVKAEQIHDNHIGEVTVKDVGTTIKGADGLITRDKELFLSVRVADCLPLLAFDPKLSILGVAHAGWKGTEKNIASTLINKFVKFGSKVENILVALGPCIEFCHYEVDDERAERFIRAGLGKAVMKSISGKFSLDIKQANVLQLKKLGVLPKNMDVSLKSCTYESDDFYSYRSEGKELAGEMAAVVGQRT